MATLNPSADAPMLSDAATTNYGTEATVQSGEWNGGVSIRRSCIKFDLSAYSGRVAIAAKLRLYDTGNDYTDNARTMNLYRLKRAWVEGQVTWTIYSTGNNWASSGAGDSTNDYDNNVVGSVSLPNPPVEGWVEIPLTVSYINEWLSGAMTNNGFLMKNETETNDLHVFNSKEAASNKPELVLDFGANFFALL